MTAGYRENPRNPRNDPTTQRSLEALVAPVARRIHFEAGTQLPLDGTIVFPIDGVATLVLHREQIRFQLGFASRGDAIGVQKLFIPEFASISAKALKPGTFVCASPQPLRRLLREESKLRERLMHHALRTAASYLDEAAQTVALSLDRLVAYWIARCGATLASDVIPITHHDLAHTLGVRRSGVTVALHVLEGQHLIRSARARIEVIDRHGLATFSRPGFS